MWMPFDNGATIGQRGAEHGIIIRDEEQESSARITLEQDCAHGVPFAVTCGVYGWFFHTRRVGTEAGAEFTAMRDGLAAVLKNIPRVGDPDTEFKMPIATNAIQEFVSRFP